MLTLDANIWIAAYDPQDRFHAQSTQFLAAVTRQGQLLNGPAFMPIEAACALARRSQNIAVGQLALARLRNHPLLTLQPLDNTLLAGAARLGVQHLLRGADALYAATAELTHAHLISWDKKLVRRTGAVIPTDWIAANP